MKKRTVTIPCIDLEIDCTRVWPIISHPLFARLAGVRQLGAAHKVFPGATHTRYEHALGTYQRTKVLAKRLVNDKVIHRWDEGALVVYGLLHDVGHGPFSHCIEALTSSSHKDNGARIIEEMRDAVSELSVDTDRVLAMLGGRDRIGAVVSDANLGTDKVDYLERDAYHIGLDSAPETKRLVRYLVWTREHGLGVSREVIEDAKKFLSDYAWMYKRVYMKKSSLLVDRHLQKMIGALLADGLSETELWLMTDAEVEGRLAGSKDPGIRWLYQHFREMSFPQDVLAIRPEPTVKFEPPGPVVHGIPQEDFDDLRQRIDHRWQSRLEKRIARAVGLKPHQVCVVAPLEERRFRPKDLTVFEGSTPISLRERDPEIYAAIERSFPQFAALRVAVFREDFHRVRSEIAAVAAAALDAIAAAIH